MELRKDLKDHTTKQCPKRPVLCEYCQEEGEYQHIVGPLHQDQCPDYPVGCPRKCEDGGNVKRKDLGNHSSVCPLEPVPCPDCSVNMPRHQLVEHGTICSKRKVSCKYKCGEIGAYDQITGPHVSECPEVLVACPRKCEGSGEMKRKCLKDHAKLCPLEPVSCPYDNIGCNPNLVRKDLNNHLKSCVQDHMLKLNKAYTKAQKKQFEMEEDLSAMTALISHGLSLIDSVEPQEKKATSFRFIKSALDPTVKANDNLLFYVPKIKQRWSSLPFYVDNGCKLRLIIEVNHRTDQQTLATTASDNTIPATISLHLIRDENIKRMSVDTKPTLRITMKPPSGKPMILDFPLKELKGSQDCLDSSGTKELVSKSTRFQGPSTIECSIFNVCEKCQYPNAYEPTTVTVCTSCTASLN